MRRIALLVAMVSAVACGGSSNTTTFGATLKQSNEPGSLQAVLVPNASGTAAVQIVGTTITYSLRGTNLSSAPNKAHIHLTPNPGGSPPQQGAVIVTFKFVNTGATVSTNSATVDDVVINAPDVGAQNLDKTPMTFTDLVNHIKNGETYVNIHTDKNTGGEIRGDLHPQ